MASIIPWSRIVRRWGRVSNQTVQRTGASRFALRRIARHRRLAPVADLYVSHCCICASFRQRFCVFVLALESVAVLHMQILIRLPKPRFGCLSSRMLRRSSILITVPGRLGLHSLSIESLSLPAVGGPQTLLWGTRLFTDHLILP